ncbi:MAG TPA: response regulator [Candidatus Saccharimonadales bacterium]|nr:response regulator [Candidatus Saccharimonadales bacterium]
MLFIEPDINLARAYEQAMQLAGHSAALAHTAQEALFEADRMLPNVIALELQLPGPNGLAFLHELRSYPDWQNIPVVLHTYAMPQAQAHIKNLLETQFGVVSWLYKPQTSLAHLQMILESHGTPK